jgi:hypothetical protein
MPSDLFPSGTSLHKIPYLSFRQPESGKHPTFHTDGGRYGDTIRPRGFSVAENIQDMQFMVHPGKHALQMPFCGKTARTKGCLVKKNFHKPTFHGKKYCFSSKGPKYPGPLGTFLLRRHGFIIKEN